MGTVDQVRKEHFLSMKKLSKFRRGVDERCKGTAAPSSYGSGAYEYIYFLLQTIFPQKRFLITEIFVECTCFYSHCIRRCFLEN